MWRIVHTLRTLHCLRQAAELLLSNWNSTPCLLPFRIGLQTKPAKISFSQPGPWLQVLSNNF